MPGLNTVKVTSMLNLFRGFAFFIILIFGLLSNSSASIFNYSSTTVNGSLNSTDRGYGIAVNPINGDIGVTGYVTEASQNIFLARYNSSLVLQSSTTISSSGAFPDWGTGITFSNNGNIYLTGQTFESSFDMWIAKYDPSCTLISSTTINGSSNGTDSGESIATDSDGNVYVIGYVGENSSGNDIRIIKFNSSLIFQSSITINGIGNATDEGYGIAIDSITNNIYATGKVFKNGTFDIWIAKYNSSLVLQSSTTINGLADNDDLGRSITYFGNNVYLTGYVYQSSNFNVWLAKYNSLLVLQSSTTIGLDANIDEGKGIVTDENGDVYVTGYVDPTGSNQDIWIAKYNSALIFQSSMTINGSSNITDNGFAIAYSTHSNAIYVTGSVQETVGASNIWISKHALNDEIISPITSLNASSGNYLGAINLTWTLPDSLLANSSYYIQYSTRSDESWNYNNAQLIVSTGPIDALTSISQQIGGLDVGRNGVGTIISPNYYFRVWITTGLNAFSVLSNSASYYANTPAIETETLTNYSDGWQTVINNTSNGSDSGYSVVTDITGNIYIFGNETTTGTTFVVIRKYDFSGVLQWTKYFKGDQDLPTSANGITLDDNGNIYITGSLNNDVFVRKYDSTSSHSLVWTKTYGTSGIDIGTKVKVNNATGDVFVVGVQGTNADDMLLLKYNSNGLLQWTTSYDKAGSEDYGTGIVLGLDGNPIITGWTNPGYNIPIRKYDALNGNEIWTIEYNAANELGEGIDIDQNGNIYIIGYKTGEDILVMKYDNANPPSPLWTKTFNGDSNGNDNGLGIKVDSKANVYVSGFETVTGQALNTWIRKYNTNGEIIWTKTYNSADSLNDICNGLAIFESTGAVYGIGYETRTGQSENLWLRKYQQTNLDSLNLSVINKSSNSVTFGWNDLNFESSYTVRTADGFIKAALNPNTTYYTLAITPNVSTSVYVTAYNTWSSSTSSISTAWALANSPSLINFSVVGSSYIAFNWDANNNPNYTRFGVSHSTSSDFYGASVSTFIAFSDSFVNYSTTTYGLSPLTTYYIRVWAYNEDQLISSYVQSSTKTNDNIAPTINNYTAGGDNVIHRTSGTVYNVDFYDDGGLDTIQYKILSLNPVATITDWTNLTTLNGTTYYYTDWSLPQTIFDNLNSLQATNYVSIRSWDISGNTTTVNNAFYIMKDTVPPSSSILTPAGMNVESLSMISGLASDNHTLDKVELQIKRFSDDTYWTGTDWGSATWLPAVNNVWQYYGLTDSNLTPGTSYWLVSRASDTIGNIETPGAGVTFTYKTKKTIGSGNWTDASTWLAGEMPLDGDAIYIKPTHKVSLIADTSSLYSLNIEDGGVLDSPNMRMIRISSMTNGGLYNYGTFTGIKGTLYIGEQNANKVIVSTDTSQQIFNSLFIITGSTVTLLSDIKIGSMYIQNNSTLDPNNKNITIVDSVWDQGGIFKVDSSTVTFKSNGNVNIQGSISPKTFSNLTIDLTAPSFVVSNSSIDVNGNFTISGGTFNAGAFNHTISGNLVQSGSGIFEANVSTITFDGTGLQTISLLNGYPFYNLQYTGSGTLSPGSDLDINGDFTKINGTFNCGSYTYNLAGRMTLSTTWSPNTSTWIFDGVSAQTIPSGFGFYNLISNNTVGLSYTGSGTRQIQNKLDIKPSATFDIANKDIEIWGNLTSSGTFTITGSTVTFASGNNQTIWTNGNTFNNVLINKSLLSNNVTTLTNLLVNGWLKVSTGTLNMSDTISTITGATDINSANGRLEIASSTTTLVNVLNVSNGGTLLMANANPPGLLKLGNSINVQSGGFFISQSSFNLLASQFSGSQYFSFNASNSTINVTGLSYEGGDNYGMLINASVKITALDNINFKSLQAGATALNLLYSAIPGTFTFTGHNFDASVTNNVSASNLISGIVIMQNTIGPKAGSSFENDPNDRIFWSGIDDVSLIQPVGSENFATAQLATIRWNTSGHIPNVILEYSKDNFVSDINYITTRSTSNSYGSYPWTIPNDPSSTVKVRVSAINNSSIKNISSSNFSIITAVDSPVNLNIALLGTTSIQWQFTDMATSETELHISSGNNTTMRLSENLGPIAGTGGTTYWWETNLSTNTSYTRYAEAMNAAGNTWSVSITSFTLANPPNNLTFPQVVYSSATLQWDVNNNPGYTRFGIASALDSNFTNTVSTFVTFASNLTNNTTIAYNLNSETPYYFRVWAFNENQIQTTFIQGSTFTTAAPDTTAPGTITGLEAYQSGNPNEIKVSWITPGKDGNSGTLQAGSLYKIQYSSTPQSVVWSTANAQVEISTNSVSRGIKVSTTIIPNPVANEVYYLRVWAADEFLNYSQLSGGTTAFCSPFTLETVDNTAESRGLYTSLTIDQSNNLHVAYMRNSFYDLLHAKYSGSWTIDAPIDTANSSGYNSSIAIDSSGNPHVAYQDGSVYDLKYASWTGTVWNVSQIEGTGYNTGYFPSLVLDANNNANISYHDGWNLKYAKFNGVTWSTSTVDGSGASNYTSIGLDGRGYPNIVYNSNGSSNLMYAKWNGSAWQLSTIDASAGAAAYNSMTIDANGNPHVAYRALNAGNNCLKYVKYTGTAWTTPVMIANKNVGNYNAIALDGSGYPHITYWHDNTSAQDDNLMYAKWNGIVWSTMTVDSYGAVGQYSSIAIDANGVPHISYYDETNAKLKHAKWIGAGLSAPMAGNIRGKMQAPNSFDAATVNAADINWQWTNTSSNAHGYRVYCSSNGGNYFIAADSVTLSGNAIDNWNQTSLTPNTSYQNYAAAVNNGGVVTSFIKKVYTKSNKPISITSTLIGYSSTTFQWVTNSNPDWTRYGISVSTFTDFSQSVSTFVAYANNLTANTTSVFGLNPETQYFFHFFAYNNDGTETDFTAASTTTIQSPVNAPNNLTVSLLGTTSIQWQFTDMATNETKLYISSGTDISMRLSENLGPIAGTGGTTYWWEVNLSTNTQYTRYAEANNNSGSMWSVLKTTHTLSASPASLTVVSRSSYSIEIDWSPNSNPEPGTSYIVSRSTFNNFSIEVNANISVSSFSVSDLEAYTTYYFKVRSVNGNSVINQNYGTIVSTITLVAQVVMASGFSGTATSTTSITWSWTDTNSGTTQEDGYYLKDSLDSTKATLSQDVIICPETGLSANVQYSRYVEAYNVSGSSKSQTISKYTLANPPLNLTFTNVGYSSATLQWDVNNNPGITRFGVASALDSNFTNTVSTFVTFASNLTNNTTIAYNLNSETPYYFRVWAFNENQIETTYIQSSTITKQSPVNAPNNLTVSLLGTTSIQWQFTDMATNETKLYISSGTDISMRLSENLGPIAGTGGTTYWWEVNLSTNTQYTRYAEANNNSGSMWSVLKTTHTLSASPASLTVVSRSSYSIEIDWSPNSNPEPGTSYIVSRSTFNNFSIEVNANISVSSFSVSDLEAYTTYYFKVRSVNGNSVINQNYGTIVSTITLVAQVVMASGFSGTATSTTSITWSWTDTNSGTTQEDGYYLKDSLDSTKATLSQDVIICPETGLSANVQYSRYVEAYNVSGSSKSQTISKYTLANPPLNLTFTNVGYSSATLQWDVNNNPGITRFGVASALDSNFTNSVSTFAIFTDNLINNTTTTFGLTSETIYYFRVWAYNENQIETTYIQSSTITKQSPVNAPNNLTVSLLGTTSIQWQFTDMATNETKLYISSGTDISMRLSENLGPIAGTGGTTYWWEVNLSTNTQYTRYAEANNNSGSMWSVLKTTHTLSASPASLTVVSRSSYSIEIDWSPNSNPEPGTSYIVSHSTNNNFLVEVNANVSTSSYIVPDLDAYTTYYFKVRSVNGSLVINQNYGTTISTSTLPAPASKLQVIVPGETLVEGSGKTGTPTNQTAGTQFNITVYATDNNYNIDASTNPLVSISLSDVYASTVSDQSLINGTKIFNVTFIQQTASAIITANASNLTSSISSSVFVLPGPSTKLQVILPGETAVAGSPTGKTGISGTQNSGNPFTITVNACDDNWNITTSQNPVVSVVTWDTIDVNPSPITLTSGSTTFIITLINIGISSITATADSYSTYTTSEINVTGPTPNAPTNLNISLLGTTSIQWQFNDNSTNETSLYISSGNNISMRLSTNLANPAYTGTVTWTENNLSTNTAYTRYVEATNGNGTVWSTSISSYTAAAKPGIPYIIQVTSYTIQIGWVHNNNSILTGFELEKSTDNSIFNFDQTVNSMASSVATLITNLTADTTYYLRIRTKNIDNVYTEYTSVISTKTLSAEIAPDLIQPTVAITDPTQSSYKNSLAVISGTASDNVFVSSVTIAIFDLNNPPNYWNGSAWQASKFWLDSIVYQSSWVCTSIPAWSDSGQYQIEAKAIDSSANWTTAYSTITFNFDITAPSSTVISPSNGSTISTLQTISGTAYDNTSLDYVELTIQRLSDGLYWNGGTWGANAWLPTNGGSPWTYSNLSSASLTLGTSYWIISRSQDRAGNVESSTIGSSVFTYITNSTQLQILAPGETNIPGIGKSGTPTTQVAGISFIVTINAVNSSYYIDTNASTSITINTSDLFDTEPVSNSLSNGTRTFSIIPITAQNNTITAIGSGLTNGTITVPVAANIPSKLQVILPGENTVAGSPLGKTGTPTTQTSGTAFNVTVNICDSNWNLAISTISQISVVTFDTADVDPANKVITTGTTTFAITLVTVGVSSISATDTNSILTSDISSQLTVSAKSVPVKPTSLTSSDITNTSIKWLWTDASANEDGYYIKTSSGGTLVSLSADSNNYSETGLLVNTQYSRYVEAYNNGGVSSTTILSKYTLTNLPSNLVVTAKDFNYISLSWSANSNPENTLFELYSSTDNTKFNLLTSTTAVAYNDKDLIQLTTYYYRLYSVNGDGTQAGPVELVVQTLNSVVKGPISGKVTQSNGQAITGVSVQLLNNDGTAKLAEVFTDTEGKYLFENVEDNVYQLVCSWYVNEIESVVYKKDVPENTTGLAFTLEINYQLAQLVGKITLGTRANLAGKFAPAQQPYIELLQHGKTIAKINADASGNYTIPNLLPGKYIARAFNGVQMSVSNEIKISEGEKQVINFVWPLELQNTEVYAYPNPTKVWHSTIRYSVLNTNHTASIKIYNLAGELVRDVKDNEITKTAPKYEFKWNLFTDDNNIVASGIYIYILELKELISGEKATVKKKMAIIK